MPKVTIFDIARRAGVSIATVSYVVNQNREVSLDAKERVEQAIRELGYTPNENARGLRRSRTNTIGLIVSDHTNSFIAEVAKGVEDAVFAAGYSVVLCNTNSIPEREAAYLDLLLSKSVAGVILATRPPDEQLVNRLAEQKTPMVVLFYEHGGFDVDAILIDNFHAGYLAASHLILLGHRKLACICAIEKDLPLAYREQGFRRAMVDHGIEADPALFPVGNYHLDGGVDAARQIINSKRPFTGLFCGNDAMAIGALRTLNDAGFRIPEDVSLVGLDDIILASYLQPPLTTIAQPKQEMGAKAVEFLLERIHKKYAGGPRKLLMEIQLVARDSARAISPE